MADSCVVRFETTSGPFYWYKQSKLVMFQNRIYSCGAFGDDLETKVFQTVLEQKPMPIASFEFNSGKRGDRFPKKYIVRFDFPIDYEVSPYSYLSLTSNNYCIYDPEFEPGVFFDRLTAPIKKIQKAMARYSRPKLQAKRLALAMSSHSRLGQNSEIRVLGSDLLCAIFRQHN
jgi:hypothetical protein